MFFRRKLRRFLGSGREIDPEDIFLDAHCLDMGQDQVLEQPLKKTFIFWLFISKDVCMTEVHPMFFLWFSGCIFAFIMTSFKIFSSFGQPERYLEYALFPGVLLISETNFISFLPSNYYWLILIYIFFYILTNSKQIYFYSKNNIKKEVYEESIKKLKIYFSDKSHRRILSVPMKFVLNLADNHNHKYFWASPFIEPYIKPEFWDETFKIKAFPFPKSLIYLKKKYNLDTVIIEKKYLSDYEDELITLKAVLVNTIEDWLIYLIDTTPEKKINNGY